MVAYDIILPILIFVLAGILARRFSYLPENLSSGVMLFAMRVALPCHILSALSMVTFHEILSYMNYFWLFLLITILVLCISFIYAKYFTSMNGNEIAAFSGSSCMSNTCMIALPILILILGNSGAVYGVLGLIVLVIMLQISSFFADLVGGLKQLPTKSRFRIALVASIKHPFVITAILGISMTAVNIKIPHLIEQAIDGFSATLAPLALFAIGFDLSFGAFKKNVVVIIPISIFKLLIMPSLAWGAAYLLHFSPQAMVAVVVSSGIAAAKCFYGLSKEKDIAPSIVGSAVSVTTVLGLITISILIYLLHSAYPSAFIISS